MNKSNIRQFILNHFLTRELFFILGKRKANIKKVDKSLKKGNLRLSNKNVENLIISLTSYGSRLKELKYTLFSLISQTIRPEKIIVNVAKNEKQFIDAELVFFEQYGIEFNYCEDLRSYKKLIPTIIKYPNKIIVTADDDLYYSPKWLEKLWQEHLLFKKDVICHLAYKITFDNNKVLPYQKWIHSAKIKDYDNSIFLLGGAGCLYPPNVLLNDVMDTKLFFSLAPYADDIWFYFMTILNRTKIRQVQRRPEIGLHYVNPYREYGIVEGMTLTNINVGEGQNDKQFKSIMDYYHISEEKFIRYLNGDIEYLV